MTRMTRCMCGGRQSVLLGAIIATLLTATTVFSAVGDRTTRTLSPEQDQRFRGLVMASREVVIGAPLEGQIRELIVRANTPVKAGDLLVQLDDDLQKEAAILAEMEIKRQELRLAEAEIQLEQVTKLVQRNSAQEWEERRSKLARDLEAVALEQARARLALEKVRLTKYQLRAPFDGVVVKLSPGREDGASLRQGDEILRMIAVQPLEAGLHLPLELYGELEIGRVYKLEAGAPVNKVLEGRLKSFRSEVDSASQTFHCTFEIDNPGAPGSQLPAGFTVRLVWPQAE